MVNFTFRGIMPPVFTPFQEDFSLNLEIIPKYVNYLHSQNIRGILVNGTSGEGMSMNVNERMLTAEVWLKETRKYGIHMMLHVGGAPLPDVIALAKHAESIGIDSILTLPELFYKPTDVSELVSYLKLVSVAAPNTPLLYYHNPEFSNVNLNMSLLAKEAKQKIPNFRGMKFTSCNLKEGNSVLTACGKDCAVFLGADQVLISALALGFDSSIGTTFNMFPQLTFSIFNTFSKNENNFSNIKEARELQANLNEIINIITAYGNTPHSLHHWWVTTMKAAMKIISGLDIGPPRPPLQDLTELQKQDMSVHLKKYSV